MTMATKRKRLLPIVIPSIIAGVIVLALLSLWCRKCAFERFQEEKAEVLQKNANFMAQYGGGGSGNPLVNPSSHGTGVTAKPNAFNSRPPQFA